MQGACPHSVQNKYLEHENNVITSMLLETLLYARILYTSK